MSGVMRPLPLALESTPPFRARGKLLLIAAAILFAGCGSILAPSEILQTTIRGDPDSLVPGDTAQIHIAVTNRSDRTLVLAHGWLCNPDIISFEVRDLRGELVAPVVPRPSSGPNVCTSISFGFSPGGSRTVTFQWTGETHYPNWNPEIPEALEPGEYRVVGIVRSSRGHVWTAEAPVQILPPQHGLTAALLTG